MAIPVTMPRQGQSVESCIITTWHKLKGDRVSTGDILFSYETDKAAFEEESPGDGVLLEIFYDEGDEVPVLEIVAVIGEPGEDVSGFRNSRISPPATAEEEGPEPGREPGRSPVTGTKPVTGEAVRPESRIRVSPLARKLAAEHGVLLTSVAGTGPHGRIIGRDIMNLQGNFGGPGPVLKDEIQATYAAGSDDGSVFRKLSNIRRIIGTKMSESLSNSAQLTCHLTADARKILALRKAVKEGRGENRDITINDMVCYSVVKALEKHTFMNAHYGDGGIRTFKNVHLGIAVDTGRGLMVPAIRKADGMNLSTLSENIKMLAENCRTGNIDPSLISSANATFTVTNLGNFGIEMFTPVLNLPQVGILGVNTIVYRPADLGNGAIGLIPVIGLSLTFDHRAVDGAPASLFLSSVKTELENIGEELLEPSA